MRDLRRQQPLRSRREDDRSRWNFDAIHVKIREGQMANRPIYVAIGVTVDGGRDILGPWVGQGGEGLNTGRTC